MIKKIVRTGILIMLFIFSGCTVFANNDADESRDTGQMEVINMPDKRPQMLEIDKGSGEHIKAPRTGDSNVAVGLKVMVIASAVLLMLIIYLRKGEFDYEEN